MTLSKCLVCGSLDCRYFGIQLGGETGQRCTMILVRFVSLVILFSLPACTGGPGLTSTANVSPNTWDEVSAYTIGVDDRVQVSVWRNPELSVTVPVRPDGKISVPLIGDVQAGGLTPEGVAATIKRKLSSFIRDPKVTVILTELKSHEFVSRVRVTGAVRLPISMPYRRGMTVLDAVLAAGGTNDFAAPDRTMLYRKSQPKPQVFSIHLGKILKKGELETNIEVKPGDVITVPERLF